jgi:hypothetical protein
MKQRLMDSFRHGENARRKRQRQTANIRYEKHSTAARRVLSKHHHPVPLPVAPNKQLTVAMRLLPVISAMRLPVISELLKRFHLLIKLRVRGCELPICNIGPTALHFPSNSQVIRRVRVFTKVPVAISRNQRR